MNMLVCGSSFSAHGRDCLFTYIYNTQCHALLFPAAYKQPSLFNLSTRRLTLCVHEQFLHCGHVASGTSHVQWGDSLVVFGTVSNALAS